MASDEEENKKLTGNLKMKQENYNVSFYLNIDDDDIKKLGYIIINDDLSDPNNFYCYYKKLTSTDNNDDNVFTDNIDNIKYNIAQINIDTIKQRYSYEFNNNFPLIEYFYLFKKNIINDHYDFLWKIDDNKLSRFDGYKNLDYGDTNENIFSNIEKMIEKKNMYIKFFKFVKEYIDNIITEDKKKIILILINTINDENIHMIYEFTYENFKSFTTKKINNIIIAKIYNSPDDYDIYILFDIFIDIKDYKYGYLEEYKNKDNFTSLSNNLKNIITYYNTIKNVNYFVLFLELEKNLKKINEIYETITINVTKAAGNDVIYTITKKKDDKQDDKQDGKQDVKQDVKQEQEVNEILNLILIDLEKRIKICEFIENNKNINKYKKLLEYTKSIINKYISDEKTKNEKTKNEINNYINNFKNCLPILLERIRYYGKNFIFE